MQLIFPKGYINYETAMSWFDCIKKYNKNSKNNSNETMIYNNDLEKIFVFEHDNIYTAGKSIQNIKKNKLKTIHNTPVFYADRGGLWTWHGKGQVIIYFIYNIYSRNIFLSDFMSAIESVVVENINFEIKRISNKTPNDIGIKVYADSEKRGFWVKDLKKNNKEKISKIGFIGLRVLNGFVCHGISINYENNLDFFNHIIPCGLNNVKITSIKELLLEKKINDNYLDIEIFKKHIGNAFLEKLNALHGEKKRSHK